MTDVSWDGQPLRTLEIHQMGEDGDFVWFRGVTETGVKLETMYLKGCV